MEWDLDPTLLILPETHQSDSISSSDSEEEEIRNESGKITTKDSVPDTTVGKARIEATDAICSVLNRENKNGTSKTPLTIFQEMEQVAKEVGISKRTSLSKCLEQIKILNSKMNQLVSPFFFHLSSQSKKKKGGEIEEKIKTNRTGRDECSISSTSFRIKFII